MTDAKNSCMFCYFLPKIHTYIHFRATLEHEVSPLKRFSIGILGNTVNEPSFIGSNLNAEKCEDMLRDQIHPAVNAIFSKKLWQNMIPTGRCSAALWTKCSQLFECFPQPWIGGREPIEWSARSPDLTPLDYRRAYFWWYEGISVSSYKNILKNTLFRVALHFFSNIISL